MCICTNQKAATLGLKSNIIIQNSIGKHKGNQLKDLLHQGNKNHVTKKQVPPYRAKANNI